MALSSSSPSLINATGSSQSLPPLAAAPEMSRKLTPGSGKHVVFGEVVEGLDIVKQVEKVGSRDGKVSSSRKAIIKDCGTV